MHIKEALGNILEKKLDLMRENFEAALTEKAMQKLEEMKIEVAQDFFNLKEETEE